MPSPPWRWSPPLGPPEPRRERHGLAECPAVLLWERGQQRCVVAQVERLVRAVVVHTIERPISRHQASQRVAESSPGRIADRDVVQAGRVGGRGRAALRLPGVEPKVMVIPAESEEGRPLVDALELQADQVAVKTDPALKVGHLQMNMTDVCDDPVGKLGLHREKAKARIVAWASVILT